MTSLWRALGSYIIAIDVALLLLQYNRDGHGNGRSLVVVVVFVLWFGLFQNMCPVSWGFGAPHPAKYKVSNLTLRLTLNES